MMASLASQRAQLPHTPNHAAPRHRTRRALVSRASATTTNKAQPEWTGDTLLSNVVNWAITNPTTFGVMKLGAKAVVKQTAEKFGIRWNAHVKELEQTAEVYAIKSELEDPSVVYPPYYTVPFHSYDEGNLSWLAAFEVEPSTYVMALRTYPKETLTPQQAMDKLRLAVSDCIVAYRQQHQASLVEVTQLLDAGCSVGISSGYMASLFPAASVTGLDLSAYMLAVAELRERRFWAQHTKDGQAPPRQRIQYKHGMLEAAPYADASFDMLSIVFVAHECPTATLQDFVEAARRLVRPGGLVCLVDNNPRSKVIQNLPPLLFTLMKSTEPWSDQYYAFDIEAALRGVGFVDVVTMESDPRHRTILGRLPLA